MDREEKSRTESGTQKRPVHRKPRRPDESISRGAGSSTVSRRPEGSAVRRAEGSAPRKADGSGAHRSEGNAVRRADGSIARRTEGSAVRRAEGSTPRRAEGSAARRTEGNTARRTEGSAVRRAEGSTLRKTEGSAVRRAEGSTPRKTEGSAARRTEGSSARKTEGSAVRRPEGSTGRRTESSALRKTEGSAARRTDGSTASRRQSADGRKRPSAAAEELRRNSERKMQNTGRQERSGKNGQQDRAMSKKKKQQKRARFNVASSVVLVVAVCVFVFSLYQLVSMLVPYYSGGKIYDEIKDLAITADEDGSGFQVDFDALMKENSDTVAWIRFDEPAIISYPVVKSADNSDYLTKTFTANDNKLGAIFMDMRNSSDFSDRNTFIYGHHLNVGGEMFSELLEYESESFCKDHPNFYIYTPDGHVRTYTVFSAGVVKDTADNYKIEYASDAEYEEYLKLCQDSSNYTVDVELNAQSQIVSLSTCTNVRDDERFLVQGVLTATD